MSFPTFPAIVPDFPASRQVKGQAGTQKLGDGYSFTTAFGLHPIEDSYSIDFNVLNSQIETISDFLNARSLDGIPFLFQTPEAIADTQPQPYAETWKCRRWDVEPDGPVRSNIQMRLERQWSHVRDV